MERVDDPAGEAAGPARALRRDLAGDAERDQRGDGRQPAVALDRQRGSDQRRAGAAHGGDEPHQRIAVRDRGASARRRSQGRSLPVSATIVSWALGETRRRITRRIAAGKGGEFRDG